MTSLFARYVAPARAHPQLWRLLLGVLVCAAVYVAGLALLFGGLYLAVGAAHFDRWAAQVATAATPLGALLLLLSFAGGALGAIAAARLLHLRDAASLFGPRLRVLKDFVTAAGIVLALFLLGLIPWALLFDGVPNLGYGLWLGLLPIALAAVALQTGAEELIFRGYLQQQLAARFGSPLVWMALPALLFALAHLDFETAGGSAWLVVAATFAFGLAAADLVAVTGSIGAAWGFHFANNIVALLILSTRGTLPGLALYVTPYDIEDTELMRWLILGDLALIALAWLLCRRALRR